MAFVKEILQVTFQGRRSTDPGLDEDWQNVVKPRLDAYQEQIERGKRISSESRAKFGHRDTQPNGHPHHMPPAEMHVAEDTAPPRR